MDKPEPAISTPVMGRFGFPVLRGGHTHSGRTEYICKRNHRAEFVF